MLRRLGLTYKSFYRSMHSIVLDEQELKIRNLLVDYCRYYQDNGGVPLTLRITGGWVRDKLLGRESHDIDIAVDHLSGEEFVSGLQAYLRQHDPELSMRHVHTIKMNPLKSKHLETCTTKLYDVDLDFVNLRSEEYSDDSRVPVIEFGTPEQDAMRRDATLNALFYNMNDSKVEDFTGTGLSDLKNGILKTPLPPVRTFLDDPLRILRLIRFACKFNFVIERSTLEAMMEIHNQKALSTKISKERIEIELRKALVSANPSYGLRLIYNCNLVESLFYVEELEQQFDRNALKSSVDRIPHHLQAASAIFPYFEQEVSSTTVEMSQAYRDFDDDFKFNFWLSMILHPYSVVPRVKNKDVYDQLLRMGLKCKKSDILKITAINMADRSPIDSFFETSVKRSDLGLYLRKFPGFADLNLLVQCFIDCIHGVRIENPLPTTPEPVSIPNEQINSIKTTIAKYEKLFAAVKELNLRDVHNLKPLLEGKTIANELGKKPGPWMKPVTDKVFIWQLDNPNGSAGECLEYIKSHCCAS